MFKFELGATVQDKVTRFKGMILGRYEYATGCKRYGVSPTKLDKDGKLQEWQTFDESRLVLCRGKIEDLSDKGGPSMRSCPNAPQH